MSDFDSENGGGNRAVAKNLLLQNPVGRRLGLIKYAGLNLFQRKSGKWQGKTKISRRGRANLRHVLNMWSLSLVRPGRIYSDYYRRKRDSDKMPGDKAMVCVMRKALKMLWGWSRRTQQFDRERIGRSAATPKGQTNRTAKKASKMTAAS